MKNIFGIDELKNKCSYWKEKFGLSHWQIALAIKRAHNMTVENSVGCNDYNIATECAAISILDTVDYPDSPFEQDMEYTLVHELLHIPMHYIANPANGTLESAHLEATISRLARVLVELRRESDSYKKEAV